MTKFLRQITKEIGGLRYASKGDEDFVAMHVIDQFDDPAGNGDEVFKGVIPSIDRNKDRHGYNRGQDKNVYDKKAHKGGTDTEETLTDNTSKTRQEYDTKKRRFKNRVDSYRTNIDGSDTVDYAEYQPKGDLVESSVKNPYKKSSKCGGFEKKIASIIVNHFTKKAEAAAKDAAVEVLPKIKSELPKSAPKAVEKIKIDVDIKPDNAAHKKHADRFASLAKDTSDDGRRREYLSNMQYHLNKISEESEDLNEAKISDNIVAKFLDKKVAKDKNSRTDGTALHLYDTKIAWHDDNGVSATMGGYPTKTTKDRLNALTKATHGKAMFSTKKGKHYFGDQEIKADEVVSLSKKKLKNIDEATGKGAINQQSVDNLFHKSLKDVGTDKEIASDSKWMQATYLNRIKNTKSFKEKQKFMDRAKFHGKIKRDENKKSSVSEETNINESVIDDDEFTKHHSVAQKHLLKISEYLQNIHDLKMKNPSSDDSYHYNYGVESISDIDMKGMARRLEDMLTDLKGKHHNSKLNSKFKNGSAKTLGNIVGTK